MTTLDASGRGRLRSREVRASTRLVPGSYTGDGELANVISLPFRPVLVLVFAQATSAGVTTMHIATPSIVDDISSTGAAIELDSSAVDVVENAITSLSSDGFTVDDAGSNSHPNKSGQVYNFVAFG